MKGSLKKQQWSTEEQILEIYGLYVIINKNIN